jgi:ribosome-binding factor A
VSIERSRDAHEAAIYSTILNGYTPSVEDILIMDRTDAVKINEELFTSIPSLSKKTLMDFRLVNLEPQVIDLPLSVNMGYKYVSIPGDLLMFSRSSPVITLSKVGFNRNFNQALVYISFVCGAECGTGTVFFLVREGNTWTIQKTIEIWVS